MVTAMAAMAMAMAMAMALSDALAVEIAVEDTNDSPQVSRQLSEQELEEGEPLQLDANTFTDQDDDSLVYELTLANGAPLPDWLIFNEATNELQLGEAANTEGSAQLLLSVTDSQGGTAQMLFSVSYLNEPDIEAALPDEIEEVSNAQSIIDELKTSNTEQDRGRIIEPNIDDNQSTSDSSSSSISEQTPSAFDTSDEPVETMLSARELFDSILDGLFETSNDDEANVQVRRNNVISAFLNSQDNDIEVDANAIAFNDVFSDSVNLAALFSSVNNLDNDGFSTLSREISKQKSELDSQISGARALVGSTLTVSSSLSVGYVIYLLRGGAIMSSVLSSLPAWRFVDPLPVLGTLGSSLAGDGESLQSIAASKSNTNEVKKLRGV